MFRFSVLLAALLLTLPLPASSQAPSTIGYQSVLTDASGNPVADGSQDITFKIYNVSTGGTALWTETQTVTTTNGVFSAVLGSVSALTGVSFSQSLWLGIAVGGGAELSPRIELTGTPYSLIAKAVDTGAAVKSINSLKDDVTLDAGTNITITPSGNMLTIDATSGAPADNSVTKIKIQDSAVTSVKIADGTIGTADITDGSIATVDLANDAVTTTQILDGTVSTGDIADGTIAAADLAGGAAVKSVNALTDAVTLAAGSNMTITPSGNTLTFDASVSGGNTLDQAYDQGGAGVGRTIIADGGAVDIQGTGGLTVNGSVGIGTTSPGDPLHVVGTGTTGLQVEGDGAQEVRIIGNQSTHAVTGADAARIIGPLNRSLAVEINGNDAADRFSIITDPSNGGAADTEVMVVRNDGKVGIGTVNPGTDFQVRQNNPGGDVIIDVRNNASTDASSHSVLSATTIAGGGDPYLNLGINGQTIWQIAGLRSDSDKFTIGRGGGYTGFGTGKYFTIDTSGNVGIGTTSPGAILHVKPAAGSGVHIVNSGLANGEFTYLLLGKGVAGDQGFVAASTYNATDASRTFAIGTNEGWSGTENLVMTGEGNVGIGTGVPQVKLDVASTANSAEAIGGIIRNIGTVTTGWRSSLVFGDVNATSTAARYGTISAYYAGVVGQTDLRFSTYTSGTRNDDVMVIKGDGKVGIGTTSPSGRLHVLESSGPAIGYIESPSGFGSQLIVKIGDTTQNSKLLFGDTGADDAGQIIYSHSNNSMLVATNGSEALRIDASGNVGIGTASPGSILHVKPAAGSGVHVVNSGLVNGEYTFLGLGKSVAADQGFVAVGRYHATDASRNFTIGTNEGWNLTENLVMTGEGKVGIGTITPANILTIQQTSTTDPIADAWTVYSSRRWKENIKPIEGALETVGRLQGVTYDWKANGQHDIGMIAEEVGEVIPEVVSYEENGVDAKSVDYARLAAVLIEAVKEQQKIIDEQGREMAKMRERMARFEAALEKMEGLAAR